MGEQVCDCGARQSHPSIPPGTVRYAVCPKCAEEDQFAEQTMAELELCPKCFSSEWYGDQERDGNTCRSCGHHETLEEGDSRRFKLLEIINNGERNEPRTS